MKLYEFTFTDHTFMSEVEREDHVKHFLEKECFDQGWALGYIWKVLEVKEQEEYIQYVYQVEGEYLDT